MTQQNEFKKIKELPFNDRWYYAAINRRMDHWVFANSYHGTFSEITVKLNALTDHQYPNEVKNLVHQAAIAYRDGFKSFPITMKNDYYTMANNGQDKNGNNVAKPKKDGSKVYKERMKKLLIDLNSAGYGEYKGGGSVRLFNHKNLTGVFDASNEFWEMFKDKPKERAPKLSKGFKAKKDTIICRVVCPDTDEILDVITPAGIAKYRNQVDKINQSNRNYDFTINGIKHATDMHRVFNTVLGQEATMFDCFGRFYNEITGIDAEIRNGLKIDGQQTIVVDFTAMHLFAAYDLFGLEWDGLKDLSQGVKPDAYNVAIDKIKGSPKAKRSLLKMTSQMLFNSGSAWASLEKDINSKLDTIKDWKSKLGTDEQYGLNYKTAPYQELNQGFNSKDATYTVNAFKEAHKAVFNHPEMKGKQAARFQNIDAEIALHTMLSAVELNIPFQCEHDGFHILPDHETQFIKCMRSAWLKVLGTDKHCFIDVDYHDQLPEMFQEQLPLPEAIPLPTEEDIPQAYYTDCGMKLPF